MSTSARKARPKGKKAPKGGAKPKAARPKKAPKVERAEKPKKVAPKERKAPPTKEAPKKAAPKELKQLALGAPPLAVVEARHLDSLRARAGRGFSFGELASAGLPRDAARSHGLSLDTRRRSVLAGNVDSLRAWLKGTGDSGKEGSNKPAAAAAPDRR